ncbi:hypothetical protein SLEP1_g11083 [Rubroshorea leprosula]|uniref:Uncharacterized protein n=1 Tax=Rubroshorea leprosula TaxID=152421 RepID=A0AAV5IJL6_9ROSI|nr:hypothetical protein SLEP1_g11083 [Rubroshorea leprosula]
MGKHFPKNFCTIRPFTIYKKGGEKRYITETFAVLLSLNFWCTMKMQSKQCRVMVNQGARIAEEADRDLVKNPWMQPALIALWPKMGGCQTTYSPLVWHCLNKTTKIPHH